MKKFFVILLLFLGIPTLADENKTVLPSETGIVESIKYEDAENLNQGETTTKQLVTVKVLTGNFKGTERIIENMLTGNPASKATNIPSPSFNSLKRVAIMLEKI